MTVEDKMTKMYDNGEFSHCTIGALKLVANDMNEVNQAESAVLAYLAKHTDVPHGMLTCIPQWNDSVANSPEEVREALLMTAKRLRNGEGE